MINECVRYANIFALCFTVNRRGEQTQTFITAMEAYSSIIMKTEDEEEKS